MRFVTSCTAFALIGGYKDGELIHLNGTSLGCTHSTIIAPVATDDYLILFSDSQGYDVPRMGQIVGRVFYLYERGEVLEFAKS